jgi:putative holliday junction resolvase
MTQPDKVDAPSGPVLALDLGQKRIGVAASDSMLISITKLAPLPRSNWKQLLRDVTELVRRLDAQTLVIGLPLGLEGSRGSAALEAENTARKFATSLKIPVYLQDERLTSFEAEEQLRAAGISALERQDLVDCQAAAIILMDFIAGGQPKILIPNPLS